VSGLSEEHHDETTHSLVDCSCESGRCCSVTARAPRHAAAQQAAPIFVTEIPFGYRDWSLISVAHEEGDLHSFAAVLGNDVAIKAYREGTPLFPDGTIIAALHYRHVPSMENNRVSGRDQSFVAGPQTNI
jgi:Cytochrome P460